MIRTAVLTPSSQEAVQGSTGPLLDLGKHPQALLKPHPTEAPTACSATSTASPPASQLGLHQVFIAQSLWELERLSAAGFMWSRSSVRTARL